MTFCQFYGSLSTWIIFNDPFGSQRNEDQSAAFRAMLMGLDCPRSEVDGDWI